MNIVLMKSLWGCFKINRLYISPEEPGKYIRLVAMNNYLILINTIPLE